MTNKNGYQLSRMMFNFAFEEKECKAIHIALFLWIVELNNRLAWKDEFGLPTLDTMDGLSIGNKNTYYTALRNLESWGFIKIIKKAKNQYQSCIISLNLAKKCRSNIDTALDTALIRHCSSTIHGTVPIDKQRNKETKKHVAVATPSVNIEFETLLHHAIATLGEKKATPAALDKFRTRRKSFSLQQLTTAFDNLNNEPDRWKIKNNGFRPLAWWLHTDDRIEEMLNCHNKQTTGRVAIARLQ